jgi:hypothetical protein
LDKGLRTPHRKNQLVMNWSVNLKGRPRRIWEDNIKMDLREMVWEGVDWIHLTQIETGGEIL